MNDMNRVWYLRFFDEKTHVNQFLDGYIRLMSAQYYIDMYKEVSNPLSMYDNRFDFFESAEALYDLKVDSPKLLDTPIRQGEFQFDQVTMLDEGIIGPMIIRNPDKDRMRKLCCLYYLEEKDINDDNLNSVVEELDGNFKDYYCLIRNPDEFNNRFTRSVAWLGQLGIGLQYECGRCNYIKDNDRNGNYGTFSKPEGLIWQHEFRFSLMLNRPDPYYLEIGNIRDVAIWGTVEELRNLKISEII